MNPYYLSRFLHRFTSQLGRRSGWFLFVSLAFLLWPLLAASEGASAQAACSNPTLVQRGDTLIRIARRCNISLEELLAANPQILNEHRIEISDPITIPNVNPDPTLVPGGSPSARPSTILVALQSATYSLTADEPNQITLNGGYASKTTELGTLEVWLTESTVLGDINGDGRTDAAAILREATAGTTGRFFSLHAMVDANGQFAEADVVSLGDRVQINSVQVLSDGAVEVDMYDVWATDGEQHTIHTYRLHLGKLVLIQVRPGSGTPSTASPPTAAPPTVTPTPTATSAPAVETCPPRYPTRLQRGTQAHVMLEPYESNRVRNAPSKGGAEISRIAPGIMVDLLDGPRCGDGWHWWYVQAETGERGWTSEGKPGEYWLAPGSPSTVQTPNIQPPNIQTPSVDSITFCTSVDRAHRCLDPANNFAYGLQRIEVVWRFQNLPINSWVHHHWYHEGERFHHRDNVLWDDNRRGTSGVEQTFYAPGRPFPAGQWRLDFINAATGQVFQSGYFTIGGSGAGNPSPPTVANFHGAWQTNFANVEISQNGGSVTGSYVRYSDTRVTRFTGSVSGQTLFAATNGSGTPLIFTLSANGHSFTGEWLSRGRSYPWCGVRSGPLPAGCGFSGTWESAPRGVGQVELVQTGPSVTGRYYNGGTWGSLSGNFDLNGPNASYNLAGTFQADTDPANDRGRFRFSLVDLDSSHFEGCWRNTAVGGVGSWCGWNGGYGSCPRVNVCE